MAHKGKFWKLQFRRDFWNFSNYRGSAAEAYELRLLTGLDSDIWFPKRLIREIGVNLNKDFANGRTWTMPHELPSGAPLRWRWIVEDMNFNTPEVCRFQILVPFDFRIFDCRFRSFGPALQGGSWRSDEDIEFLIVDSGFQLTPGQFAVGIEAATYDRYNP